jgi:hypothetical protein
MARVIPAFLHLGHFGALWEAVFRTRKLKIFLHRAQAYSYIGIPGV